MAILKCKMCGGDLNLIEDNSTAECEFCGSVQTVPKVDDEKKMTLFARANRLRAACEFDKAAGIYESIVAEFPEEAEAYWGLILCKYGIEYVDDPATGKKIPTCHRSSFDSIMDDSDLEQVLENADLVARRVYREEAKAIEELRKGIVEVSSKEEPYDIFICYKETAEDGQRTLDSVLAQDIYDALTEKGYRVFFSRITLEDKLGVEYEPFIFAALNSAKIMLAVGTDYEYYNAVWVKNEWSRYLKLMAKDKAKHLIPCFKNLDAYDMPKEFAKLQAQDLGKVGAMQDLLRGIEKLLPKEKNSETVSQPIVAQQIYSGPATAPLLRRGQLYLEDGDWRSATEYFDKVLDMDPECAEAYVGKLCAELRCSSKEDLANLDDPFDSSKNYEKAIRFANDILQRDLTGYINSITTRNKERAYQAALSQMSEAITIAQYSSAANAFGEVGEYRDAPALQEKCTQLAMETKKNVQVELAEISAEIEILRQKELALSDEYSQKIKKAKAEAMDLEEQCAQFSVFRANKKEALQQQLQTLNKEIAKMEQEKADKRGELQTILSRLLQQRENLTAQLKDDKYGKMTTYRVDRMQPFVTCPRCGTMQKSNRDICFQCSLPFEDLH